MSDYSEAFQKAFDHAMIYEVGPFWDPTDPDVIAGKIDTQQQRRKVGYTNIPHDHGGVTKYGVSQNNFPNIDVNALDLQGAWDFYWDIFWLKTSCDKMPSPLTILQLDGCINHGPGRGVKFLQTALGLTADGGAGPMTIAAAAAADQGQLIQKISDIRTAYYNAIVQRDSSQAMFLAGWLRRVNEVTQYTLSQLSS
jgi:lysozyme family protein